MAEWCIFLWLGVTGCAQGANFGISWALDNLPAFKAWWERRSAGVKRLLYAVTTAVVGGLSWLAGHLLACADWAPFATASYIVGQGVVGWFVGYFRHKSSQRASKGR